jgi:DNA-binding NarL/FixJ family response regulator
MTALTPREADVMRLICEGLTAQGVGEALGISSRTVEIHRRNAIIKLGARNQTQAAVLFDRAQREQAA